MRRSHATRWRVAVLVIVHLLFLAHIWHLVATGESITPLEPSESMELADRSVINAGLVFFAVTILTTLIFGRFFCGWGCHLLALQDLCTGILTRLGIKPKPLRSRALLVIPFLAAFWMFGWPLLYRVIAGLGVGVDGVELTGDEFWATFPGPIVAIVTFVVCGFATVYFLGSKGFCTYACPYGAFFSVAEKVSPLRIRVDDNCDGCGHCTATCTSNVAVASEVRDWGMVVDSGCMKCLDCVSVCPTNALSLSFGRPALGASPRAEVKPVKARFGNGEEVFMLVMFALAFFAVHEVWVLHKERIPFLLALGIAGIMAGLSLTSYRLLTRSRVGLQHLVLKEKGSLTGRGKVYWALFIPLVALWIHTGVVRWQEHRAQASMTDLGPWTAAWFGPERPTITPEFEEQRDALGSHAAWLERFALVEGGANAQRRVWAHILSEDWDAAHATASDLFRRHPDEIGGALLAADVAALKGDRALSIEAYQSVLDVEPERHDVLTRLVPVLVESGQPQRALDLLESSLQTAPDEMLLNLQHASVSLSMGYKQGVETRLRRLMLLQPEQLEPRAFLIQFLTAEGRVEDVRGLLAEPGFEKDPVMNQLRRAMSGR